MEESPTEKARARGGPTRGVQGAPGGPRPLARWGAGPGPLRLRRQGPGVARTAHPRRRQGSPSFLWGRVGRPAVPSARRPSLPSAGSRLGVRPRRGRTVHRQTEGTQL